MKHNHQQIECPNCGTAFELDKNKFASIISQVKEIEIDRQVSEKVRILKDKLESESKLVVLIGVVSPRFGIRFTTLSSS